MLNVWENLQTDSQTDRQTDRQTDTISMPFLMKNLINLIIEDTEVPKN